MRKFIYTEHEYQVMRHNKATAITKILFFGQKRMLLNDFDVDN